jgi:hypothetical protein
VGRTADLGEIAGRLAASDDHRRVLPLLLYLRKPPWICR